MERPERAALVEPEAGVDNHGDPEGSEEGEEWQVAALAVVANDAGCGVVSSFPSSGAGGGGVAAEGPPHYALPQPSSAPLNWSRSPACRLLLLPPRVTGVRRGESAAAACWLPLHCGCCHSATASDIATRKRIPRIRNLSAESGAITVYVNEGGRRWGRTLRLA